MGINQNLKKYRELNGLTQQDVSESLNISRQSVSKWENDKSYPDLDNLLLLSQLYNVTVDDLLGDTSPKVNIKQRKKNESSILLLISIINFFIIPIGGIIAIIVLKKNNTNKKYHTLIKILCIACLILSFFIVCLILFFSLFFHV